MVVSCIVFGFFGLRTERLSVFEMGKRMLKFDGPVFDHIAASIYSKCTTKLKIDGYKAHYLSLSSKKHFKNFPLSFLRKVTLTFEKECSKIDFQKFD